ncbi:MAG TPA: hypothetical protein VME47_11485 [Acetobacteraceae bacterium]|nr:hypothetical protein [Acetobacteraceae bacterium]
MARICKELSVVTRGRAKSKDVVDWVRKVAEALKAEHLERSGKDIRQLAHSANNARAALSKVGMREGSKKRSPTKTRPLTVPIMDAAVQPDSVSKEDINKAIRVSNRVLSL